MKKLFLIPLVCAALPLGACRGVGNKTNEERSQDSGATTNPSGIPNSGSTPQGASSAPGSSTDTAGATPNPQGNNGQTQDATHH